MGIVRPTIVVRCDFPKCTESKDTLVYDPDKIYWNLLGNFGWLRIDTGYYSKEYFCPSHKRWFESRTALPYKYGDEDEENFK